MCNVVWWADFGAHQAALSLPLLNRTEGENVMKKPVNQDKDRDVTHQLTS